MELNVVFWPVFAFHETQLQRGFLCLREGLLMAESVGTDDWA